MLGPLHEKLSQAAHGAGVERAWALENDLITPLTAAQAVGVGVSQTAIQDLIAKNKAAAELALASVKAALGVVNANSAVEVGKAVASRFHINLPGFDESTLTAFASTIPCLTDLVTHRKARSRQATAENWLQATGTDSRIHPTFKSLAAATGRMSCSDPNLQNAPRDSEARSCFIPAPGYKLIVADYSLSQLRIAADITEDPELLRCFRATPPIDPHKRTASFILGVPIEAVTAAQRAKAKAINFGLLFGMTPNGLVFHSKEIYGVTFTEDEAENAHRRFFELYRGLATWHAQAQTLAPKALHARTAAGRIRRLSSSDPKLVRKFLNTPIQGTEAEAIKRAVALAYPQLLNIGAYIIHLIHDEMVVEAPEEVAEHALAIVVWAMKTGMSEFVTKVPVEVEAKIFSCWAKG